MRSFKTFYHIVLSCTLFAGYVLVHIFATKNLKEKIHSQIWPYIGFCRELNSLQDALYKSSRFFDLKKCKVKNYNKSGVIHGVSTTFTSTFSKSHETSRICRPCWPKLIHNISFLNFVSSTYIWKGIYTMVLYEKFLSKMILYKRILNCTYRVLTMHIYSDS